MQLIFSDTSAGTAIPATYNNQADYLKAIPALANSGMVYMATTVKKLPKVMPLNKVSREDFGTHWLYRLPGSCWRLMNGGLIWPKAEGNGQTVYSRFHDYKLYGNRELLIAKSAPGLDAMLVEFYRYPKQLGSEPADDEELDGTLETQSALPYYVAAQLVMYDDAFRYATLWNIFEERLVRMGEPVHTEYDSISDAYSGFGTASL